MIKGFKEFIMRGNVIDLAVAFVMGLAFATVVSSFVTALVKPIISALPGGSSTGLGFSLRGGKLKTSTFIDISALINALVIFVVTAAVLYFLLVLPMNKIAERRACGLEPESEAKPGDILLLEQIRDLLSNKTV
jgi:large conductance mechanosensitive channel